MENPNFLKQKYNLHNTPEVESAAKRTEARSCEKVSQKPDAQIQNYLDRFKEVIEREDESGKEQGITALKKILHNNLVIKEDNIPQSYFINQQRLAREQGYGDIEIGEGQRQELTEVIIADQKSSLNNWIDYLSSEDAMYPDWLKYYTIRSISQLGKYDKEKKEFTKRTKSTTEPFPDINREALAYVLDEIIKKYQNQIKPKEALELRTKEIESDNTLSEEEKENRKTEQAQFQEFLNNENFAKLYAFAIEKVTPASKERLENIEGKWIKYNRNSDHVPLVKSLQGRGTGWCTAGESTAKAQLQSGDFYVYYSNDEKNNPSIPRVAIRMNGSSISEVRGIAPDQNLDPHIFPVVNEKLSEFGQEGEKYQKKSADMKRLTEIDNRFKKGEELIREDLRFLYQIDSEIKGFGFEEDPRINEILHERDKRGDLSNIFNCLPEQISLTKEEALGGDVVFHYGSLYLSGLSSAEGLKLPDSIAGNLDLGRLSSVEGLKLPDSIGGDLNLNHLRSTEGLKLPDSIAGNLNLGRLISAEGLNLPSSIGGSLYLSGLSSAEGLKLPDSIAGNLDLGRLSSVEGLKLPDSIGRSLDLNGLRSAEGLNLSSSIGGDLSLGRLISAEGLKLPNSIGGSLVLNHLISAEGLNLPSSIGGSLYLYNLRSSDKQKLRENYPHLADKI